MSTGTVKFFNPSKGFGFITPSDGGTDIFVHISAVEQAGLSSLNEGDEVAYEVEQDRRTNKQNAGNLQFIREGSPAPRSSAPRGGGGGGGGGYGDRPPRQDFGGGSRGGGGGGGGGTVSGSGSGTVKWFNTTKGFGFIQPNDGGGDVFVHISALEQAGLRGLNEGDRVAYELESDRRSGKTSAVNLRVER